MADIHLWQVALGLKTDPGLSREQALALLMEEEKKKQERIDNLSKQMDKALEEVDALKKGTSRKI